MGGGRESGPFGPKSLQVVGHCVKCSDAPVFNLLNSTINLYQDIQSYNVMQIRYECAEQDKLSQTTKLATFLNGPHFVTQGHLFSNEMSVVARYQL